MFSVDGDRSIRWVGGWRWDKSVGAGFRILTCHRVIKSKERVKEGQSIAGWLELTIFDRSIVLQASYVRTQAGAWNWWHIFRSFTNIHIQFTSNCMFLQPFNSALVDFSNIQVIGHCIFLQPFDSGKFFIRVYKKNINSWPCIFSTKNQRSRRCFLVENLMHKSFMASW